LRCNFRSFDGKKNATVNQNFASLGESPAAKEKYNISEECKKVK
jgi:hypothetical protein